MAFLCMLSTKINGKFFKQLGVDTREIKFKLKFF